MSRSGTTLEEPDGARDYSDFPSVTPSAGLSWYRAHSRENSPWFFSSRAGRFNLYPQRGTLHTASSPEVAVRELLGRALVGSRYIPASTVSGKRVSALALGEVRAADFTSGAAPSFGVVPGDVSSPQQDGYAVTRSWAVAMDTAGFGGILARSRFGTGANPRCLYLFGDEGRGDHGSTLSEQSMLDVIATMSSVIVDPTPTSDVLIVDPE